MDCTWPMCPSISIQSPSRMTCSSCRLNPPMRSFSGSWAANPTTAVRTAEVVTRPTKSMLACSLRFSAIRSRLPMMKIRSRRIFGLEGKIRRVGRISRTTQTRHRLMAIDVRMPVIRLRSRAAETGIRKDSIDCSVVYTSRAIHGLRHGNRGIPRCWQMRLVINPVNRPIPVISHCNARNMAQRPAESHCG